MDRKKVESRAFAALMGLAAGDALGWPALYHRSYLLPFWTRRVRREMEVEAEDALITRIPMPFSLNQPADVFAIGPTDDTEWAAFTAKQLLSQGGNLELEKLTKAWLELARSESPVRGSVSVRAALANLRQGKMPPACGHDHPHYFDDSAMVRAIPIGIVCAGRPERAAELAVLDAMFTNAGEGLVAAQAMAVIMSLACVGEKFDGIVAQALAMLPEQSWLGLTVRRALAIAESAESILAIFPLLSDQIINREYNYVGAPETLALTLAIIKVAGGDFESAVFAAAACAKTADSLPALVGAISGALMEQEFDYRHWLKSLRWLKGICIPSLQGQDWIQIANDLAQLAEKSRSPDRI